jgi:hypothetical protein
MLNMNLDNVTTFLGWCSLINIVLLTVISSLLILGKNAITRLHGKMFGLDDNELKSLYFQYLGQYKILIIIFNLVPYLALKLMS